MTFGALAAWQAWLFLAAIAAAAAWLFLVKLRPPSILVPSLLFWRRVLDESRERTLWERIRRAVSLVATVLIALALALAATRPSRAVGKAAAGSRGRLLIVLDSSWSMLARTGSGETRWARALAEARRLAIGASGDEVALATTADGLIEGPTTDLALIETGLEHLTPAGGEVTSWPRIAGTDSVHFVTDGAVARPLDPAVVVHSVFEPAANVAITAFEVRPSLDGRSAGEAYLEISNFAASAQPVHLTITRGDATVFDRLIDVSANEAIHQAMPITRGSEAVLRAHIDGPQNALPVDDDAVAWIEHTKPLSVMVVGEQTTWLRSVFSGNPDIAATYVRPAEYQAPREGVVIFDRWAPPASPTRPALYFAPPKDTAWLTGKGQPSGGGNLLAEEKHPRWITAGSHPVVHGVDPFTIAIEAARPYGAPDLVPVAKSEKGTPLVYVRESSTDRLVLVTFGAGESNLAAAPGFPVLIGDAVDWLARPVSAGGARRPGPATFDEAISKISTSAGASVPLVHVGHAMIGILPAPGLYTAESGGVRSTFAVNVGDPQVSNLTRTSLTRTEQARAVSAGAPGNPWWLYCALAAFVLVLAEWWTWQRRITV